MNGKFESVYIARQPILDENGELSAYELLFRCSDTENRANFINSTSATAQVLRNSVVMGLKNIVGNNKAFFNCNRQIILSDILSIIDSNIFVLEILESVKLEDEIIFAVKKLKEENNFIIALDDFVYNEENISRVEKIMEYIDIIKVDLLDTPRDLWKDSAKYISKHGKISLAEKVETTDEFEACKRYGFNLFQGYFFAKPQIIEGAKVSASAAIIIDLLQYLRKGGDHKGIEQRFKQSPEMTLGLMKLINSVAFGLRYPVSSVSHAVLMFGEKNLERWLILLLYAQKDGKTVGEPFSPLFENISMRAAMMENIAKAYLGAGKIDILAEKAYIVGLVSRMDTLFGMEMENVLQEFNFDDEINSAVLYNNGTLGKMLDLINAYENDDSEQIKELSTQLNISPKKFSQCVRDSFKKVLI